MNCTQILNDREENRMQQKRNQQAGNPSRQPRRRLWKLDVQSRVLHYRWHHSSGRAFSRSPFGVPYHGSWRSVLCCCSGAGDPAGLDHMDRAPVCLWRRRDRGTGSGSFSLIWTMTVRAVSEVGRGSGALSIRVRPYCPGRRQRSLALDSLGAVYNE